MVPRRRAARVIAYLLFAASGLAATAWPSPSVAHATGWLVYVWAAWLILGGGLSAHGAITGRWLGEYAGLPLLAAAFGVYGLIIALGGRLAAAAGAAVLWAIGAMLLARWQDIGAIRREAVRVRDAGDPGR